MPTKQQHISKSHIAEAAQLVLQADSNKHLDWVVITAFYCALHWVDAFFATINYHPRNHIKRGNAIDRCAILDPIRQNYKRLYDASNKARYGKQGFTKTAEISKLIQVDLPAVVTYINGLINPTQT